MNNNETKGAAMNTETFLSWDGSIDGLLSLISDDRSALTDAALGSAIEVGIESASKILAVARKIDSLKGLGVVSGQVVIHDDRLARVSLSRQIARKAEKVLHAKRRAEQLAEMGVR